MPRRALDQPAYGKEQADQWTAGLQRLDRVRTARRVEPAGRRPCRADPALIHADRADERCDQRRSHGLTVSARPSRVSARSRSVPRSADDRLDAAGFARTTTRSPGSNTSRRSHMRWRSRRVTSCRRTALPTLRPTTKPTRADSCRYGDVSPSSAASRYTTRAVRPARRPRRTTAVKSSRRRSRAGAGNTQLRPTGCRGPCGAGRRGWPDPRGSASAAETRASWPGVGCWAGTCACSPVSPGGLCLPVADGGSGTAAQILRLGRQQIRARSAPQKTMQDTVRGTARRAHSALTVPQPRPTARRR